jgi:hypothetical protein
VNVINTLEEVGTGVEEIFSVYVDPEVVRSARLIYQTYYEVHPELTEPPLGVAINRLTHRGKLIFTGKPILLPQECFVPFEWIELVDG